jgi:TolB-like protein
MRLLGIISGAGIFLLLASCSSVKKHVWVPEEPEKARVRSDFNKTYLVLTSFQVLNLDEKDNFEDIRYLRGKFSRYLMSRNAFREIRDISLGAGIPEDGNYLTMEVVVTPDYSRYRTIILDIPFFFPYPFIWPLTPLWGAAEVNVKMDMFDRYGSRVESISVTGEDAYWMLFYTYYRTAPIEDALREAYSNAFLKASLALAGERNRVIAYLDSLDAVEPVSDAAYKPAVKIIPENRKSIAVLPLNAIGVSPVGARAVTNRLTSELFRSGLFAVVEREKMKEILDEQGFQMSGCTSSECLVEAGKLLSVELMLGGSLSKLGDYYSLELRIIDVETGSILSVGSADIQGNLNLMMSEGVKKAVRQLSGK